MSSGDVHVLRIIFKDMIQIYAILLPGFDRVYEPLERDELSSPFSQQQGQHKLGSPFPEN